MYRSSLVCCLSKSSLPVESKNEVVSYVSSLLFVSSLNSCRGNAKKVNQTSNREWIGTDAAYGVCTSISLPFERLELTGVAGGTRITTTVATV